MSEDAQWPRLVRGRWVESPLVALAHWADSTDQSMVAVPVDLLREASRWRECSARHTATHDEDGLLPKPIEVICRRRQGHDDPRNPDHVRGHHNGYAGWPAERGESVPVGYESREEYERISRELRDAEPGPFAGTSGPESDGRASLSIVSSEQVARDGTV